MKDKKYFDYSRKPNEIIDGDYYFNSDFDGDSFNDTNVDYWFNGGFKKNFKNALTNSTNAKYKDDILKLYSNNQKPFLEIACGPGMGLAPIILNTYPNALCLASDASSLLIKSWRKYINDNLKDFNIELASFSIFDIPLYDESVDVVTSYIGISSSRSGEDGVNKAINEVYRILKKGGYLICVESEWDNIENIEKVFKLWKRPVWKDISERSSKTFKQRFTDVGFEIIDCSNCNYYSFRKDDNELGEQASKYNIEITTKQTLFILRKN